MRRFIGRLVLAALLVVAIGASAAAGSVELPLGIGTAHQPAADGSASPPTHAPPRSRAPGDPSRQVGRPTTTVGRTATPRVVSFLSGFSYDDGVSVRVRRVQRTRFTGHNLGVKVKHGHAMQILTISITNPTRTPVRVAVAAATMTYGSHHLLATEIHNDSTQSIVGSIGTGQTWSGRYAFAVPKKYLNSASLEFAFDTTHLPALFTGSLDYSPGNHVVFNNPRGSKSEQFAISKYVERSIDATPKGATIQIAHYSFDIARSANRLVAAHDRGVNVQMIVDQHEDIVTPETRRLMRELGTHRKRKSFIIRCKASCMSSHTSAMHAKFYLFSKVGGAQFVSMIGSANLTHTNSSTSWNDQQTVVGDAVLYASLQKYFRDMAPDKNRPHYYRTTTSGNRELYLFPRASRSKPVVLLSVLRQVSCTGAASGYGTKDRHTIIRVGMYSWTSDRIDIARQLWRLHNKGCLVQIVYNSGRTTSPVTHTLLRRSDKHGQLNLHDAWIDRNLNNKPEQYMHEKVLTINGVLSGRPNTKVVYAGSQNFTPNATTDNNDLILRTAEVQLYDRYADNFNSIRRDTPRLRYFVRGFQHDPLQLTAGQ